MSAFQKYPTKNGAARRNWAKERNTKTQMCFLFSRLRSVALFSTVTRLFSPPTQLSSLLAGGLSFFVPFIHAFIHASLGRRTTFPAGPGSAATLASVLARVASFFFHSSGGFSSVSTICFKGCSPAAPLTQAIKGPVVARRCGAHSCTVGAREQSKPNDGSRGYKSVSSAAQLMCNTCHVPSVGGSMPQGYWEFCRCFPYSTPASLQ